MDDNDSVADSEEGGVDNVLSHGTRYRLLEGYDSDISTDSSFYETEAPPPRLSAASRRDSATDVIEVSSEDEIDGLHKPTSSSTMRPSESPQKAKSRKRKRDLTSAETRKRRKQSEPILDDDETLINGALESDVEVPVKRRQRPPPKKNPKFLLSSDDEAEKSFPPEPVQVSPEPQDEEPVEKPKKKKKKRERDEDGQPIKKARKKSRQIIEDEDEEDEPAREIAVVVPKSHTVEPPPVVEPEPPDEEEPETVKENIAPPPLVLPRRVSTPMSDLIRRVNSQPGSPFSNAKSTRTAYSPLLKSSRSFLSKIAPLHMRIMPAPPPPPRAPPPKKTKKELEREERWEEELEDSVEGWAAMSNEERALLRRQKRDMELGYE